MEPQRHGDERRRRLLHRVVPIAAAAAAAFVAGAIVGAGASSPARDVVQRFADAWERGDYAAMRALTTDDAKRRYSATRFAQAYAETAATATAIAVDTGRAGKPGDGGSEVPVRVRTRIFGTIAATARIPVSGDGDGARIEWTPSLAWPGMHRGETLSRHTTLPPRASLLARDNTPLAKGPSRTSPLGAVAAEIAGRLGPAPADRATALRAAGVPPDAQVGISGLERVFDRQLTGRPGGLLTAGERVIASSTATRAGDVRTTIDPKVEEAAIAALAGRYGGVAAIVPRTGEVLALAGIAFSAPQPPGSTFKVLTAAAALEAGIVRPQSTFAYADHAVLSGVDLQNANGESCGGTFTKAFAESCNSVFAPLGAKLGARRLVAAALRFGFNETPSIPGAAASTIPRAEEIGDDLAVGSTAIGQGRVQATALQMASVAATIAQRGRRIRPTLRFGERTRPVRVIGRRTAITVMRLMRGVVRYGTGTAAAIPGGDVAGKTGTAELKTTVAPDADVSPEGKEAPTVAKPDPTDTDAWFAAFAPAGHPKIAVCVMLVRAGAGGETAAPAARGVLSAGLARKS